MPGVLDLNSQNLTSFIHTAGCTDAMRLLIGTAIRAGLHLGQSCLDLTSTKVLTTF